MNNYKKSYLSIERCGSQTLVSGVLSRAINTQLLDHCAQQSIVSLVCLKLYVLLKYIIAYIFFSYTFLIINVYISNTSW